MTKLEAELKELTKNRRIQRKSRARSRLSTVSLVGYTNAGKSTVLNRLTDAGVLVEDRLFATLDPRTRRLQLPGGEAVLLSDTVGFVRKLPHQLVEAFRSTLEVVKESDLLVHVVDSSAASPEAQIDAVRSVLAEIGAEQVPELLAFNKADLASDADRLAARYPGSVVLSALTGEGIDEFLQAIGDRLRALADVVELVVPFERGDVLAAVHREGEVLVESHSESAVRLRVRVDQAGAARFREFLADGSGPVRSRSSTARPARARRERVRSPAVSLRPAGRGEGDRRRPPGGIVDLSIGTPTDPPPPAVTEALARADEAGSVRGYPASIGSATLRRAISDWAERRLGVDLAPSTRWRCASAPRSSSPPCPSGCKLRTPDRDTILYPAISYPTYEMGAILAGLRAVPVPVDADWRLDLSAVAEADAERALALWVNTPGNPAGQLDDLAAAAAWGRSRGVPVFSDECYVEFTWDGPRRTILSHRPRRAWWPSTPCRSGPTWPACGSASTPAIPTWSTTSGRSASTSA